MSIWTDIRDPFASAAVGASIWPGLAYDKINNKGVFTPDAPQGGAYDGIPGYPRYNPVFDYTMSAGMSGPAQQRLQGEATRTGPSPWAKLGYRQQDMEEMYARDRASQNASGQTQQALSGIASSGGLTSGARERAFESGQRGAIAASQDAAKQGSLNRMQIGINDEQNRLQNLGTAAGMESTNNLANLSAKMKAAQSLNDWNMNLYGTNAQTWAAGKQAQATENSGKK